MFSSPDFAEGEMKHCLPSFFPTLFSCVCLFLHFCSPFGTPRFNCPLSSTRKGEKSRKRENRHAHFSVLPLSVARCAVLNSLHFHTLFPSFLSFSLLPLPVVKRREPASGTQKERLVFCSTFFACPETITSTEMAYYTMWQ